MRVKDDEVFPEFSKTSKSNRLSVAKTVSDGVLLERPLSNRNRQAMDSGYGKVVVVVRSFSCVKKSRSPGGANQLCVAMNATPDDKILKIYYNRRERRELSLLSSRSTSRFTFQLRKHKASNAEALMFSEWRPSGRI